MFWNLGVNVNNDDSDDGDDNDEDDDNDDNNYDYGKYSNNKYDIWCEASMVRSSG